MSGTEGPRAVVGTTARWAVAIAVMCAVAGACSVAPTVSSGTRAIVVTSAADVVAPDGTCTLREAVTAANSDLGGGAPGECAAGHGTDTIRFAIPGPGDYEIDGEPGHTISLGTSLPPLTAPVLIDGRSQPGATANGAPSPRPLDGRLLIRLQGSAAGPAADGLTFAAGSDGSTARGLVIGGFGAPGLGAGVIIAADRIRLQGDYIGTDPTGTTADGNGTGFTSPPGHRDEVIGGTRPEDRNLISGNAGSGGYPHGGATVLGNYLGLDASGTRSVPNGTTHASGALSIDDVDGVRVGGTEPGATNVVSGNASHGLAPDDSPGLRIVGNLIGTDWTGEAALPNFTGVTISGDQHGSVIGGDAPGSGNVISGNAVAGILDGSTGRLTVAGNVIGLDRGGHDALPNEVGVAARSDVVLGGPAGGGNVVSGNDVVNVLIRGADGPAVGATVSGNLIGTDADGEVRPGITAAQGVGVWIDGDVRGVVVGGDVPNRILGDRGLAVAVSARDWPDGSTSVPDGVQVTGNVVGRIAIDERWPGAGATAIDWFDAADPTDDSLVLSLVPAHLAGLGPGPATSTGDLVAEPPLLDATGGSVRVLVAGPAGGTTRVDIYACELACDPTAGATLRPVAVIDVTNGTSTTLPELPTTGGATRWLVATASRPGPSGATTSEVGSPVPAPG